MSTIIQKTGHSPLGGSGAERWMNCSGSVVIMQELQAAGTPVQDEESEFAKAGTDAHELAAHCLRNSQDAWEFMGTFNGGAGREPFTVDGDMAKHVQVYLDYVRNLRTKAGHKKSWVEQHVSSPKHRLHFGTVDDGEFFITQSGSHLDIVDLKYGAGIAVDAEDNKQMKYYGVGMIEQVRPDTITLHIVQPRAFHPDGPIRTHTLTFEELVTWRDEELIPAMVRAEIDGTLRAGEWCRFCPAKIVCPLLTGIFGAAAKADASALPNFSNDALARNLRLVGPTKMYLKALEAEAFKRANAGAVIDDGSGDEEGKYKLVYQKADRVFRSSVETPEGEKTIGELLEETFGGEAYTKPDLKTPAGIDKLGPAGKEFTKRYAFTPHTTLTLVPGTDKRTAVKVTPLSEKYADFAMSRPVETEKPNE